MAAQGQATASRVRQSITQVAVAVAMDTKQDKPHIRAAQEAREAEVVVQAMDWRQLPEP
jgi:hypothetical protein